MRDDERATLARHRATVRSVLTEGATAPTFTLKDQHGNDLSLTDVSGQWVVLWWYPKAATPG